jgi:histidine ammonia-lyase
MDFFLTKKELSLSTFESLLESNMRIQLSDSLKDAIQKCQRFLEAKVIENKQSIYGVNTGFGYMCNTTIASDELEQLQRNLLLSHACGVGEEVPEPIVKCMLLLKIVSLAQGYSGVHLQTIERLTYFYNEGIYPIVYQQGSLGASGDLVPLAHLSLPLIGEGEVCVNGKRMDAKRMLKLYGLNPLVLRPKEGLALLNGTQFMTSYAVYSLTQAIRLWENWNLIAALSLEAFDGKLEPFNANVNALRKQEGQIETAAIFRKLLENSPFAKKPKVNLQDPYSFRCIPQVHGASKDVITFATQIIEREINAVTDNPTVFPDEDQVLSAGNFHGQPLSLCMDFLAIAMSEMASISERRCYKLLSGTRGLPLFLVANPGLNSGLMIAQYTCASVVSQNKQLCSPSSVDTIDSSNGQEDHVSMGANAGTKLYRIIENCQTVQAIELILAAQAFEFRRPEKTSDKLEMLLLEFRQHVSFLKDDAYLHPIIAESIKFTRQKLSL